jgi:hypothetical protein
MAVSWVTPHVVAVDAGRIELAARTDGRIHVTTTRH